MLSGEFNQYGHGYKILTGSLWDTRQWKINAGIITEKSSHRKGVSSWTHSALLFLVWYFNFQWNVPENHGGKSKELTHYKGHELFTH